MVGDPGEALRAKVELARRHAEELRAQAVRQREEARRLRAAEQEQVEAARTRAELCGPTVRCTHCGAVWRSDAIREAIRRKPGCLLCGGRLAPLP